MRLNAQRVLGAWLAGRADRRNRAIWTDGESIYSYDTALVQKGPDGFLILNLTKYSKTTSQHQTALAAVLLRCGFSLIEVFDVPIGTHDLTPLTGELHCNPGGNDGNAGIRRDGHAVG